MTDSIEQFPPSSPRHGNHLGRPHSPPAQGLDLLSICYKVTPPFSTILNLIFLPWLFWAFFSLMALARTPSRSVGNKEGHVKASFSESGSFLELLLPLPFVFLPRLGAIYGPSTIFLFFEHFIKSFYSRFDHLLSVIFIVAGQFHPLRKIIQVFYSCFPRQGLADVSPYPYDFLSQKKSFSDPFADITNRQDG